MQVRREYTINDRADLEEHLVQVRKSGVALESEFERAVLPRRAGVVARGVGGRVGGGLAAVRGVRRTTVDLERAVRRGALVATRAVHA